MYKLENFAIDEVAVALGDDPGDTTLTVDDGSVFPDDGDFMIVVCVKATASTPESNHEIMKVTARSVNELTVVRAQEGTSRVEHAAGELVALRITKGVMEEVQDAISTHEDAEAAGTHGSASAATADKLVHRDGDGRARVADPSHDQDIDTQGARNTAIGTHAALTATHGVSGAIVGTSDTQTLTNKTLTATTNVVEEITTTASSATPAPTGGSLRNLFTVTALEEGATFAAPSGTPANGNRLVIRIKDNGTARSLAWNAIYRAMEFALPDTTVVDKTMYLGFIYNSADSKWDMVAINTEA